MWLSWLNIILHTEKAQVWFWSGHMPRLWVWFLFGVFAGDNWSKFLSNIDMSPSPSPLTEINKNIFLFSFDFFGPTYFWHFPSQELQRGFSYSFLETDSIIEIFHTIFIENLITEAWSLSQLAVISSLLYWYVDLQSQISLVGCQGCLNMLG